MQLANKSEGELVSIKGIDKRKANDLAKISKLYLNENEITNLKKSIKGALKEFKYTIVDNKGKLKYYFKDIDILALRPVETENGKGVLLITPVRLFDIRDLLRVSERKVRTVNVNSDLKFYAKQVVNATIYRLVRSESEILQDLYTEGPLFQLIKERWNFSLEKTFLDKGLFLHKNGKIYRIIISKVLVCGRKVSSLKKGLTFPYHKSSNSYVINYLKFAHLLSYIKAKVQFFENHSRENSSYSNYKHKKSMVRILFLLWILLFGMIAFMGAVIELPAIIYLEIGGYTIPSFIFFIFYSKFIRLRRKISKIGKTPYYKRRINFKELNPILKDAGASFEFQKQFIFEHKPLI